MTFQIEEFLRKLDHMSSVHRQMRAACIPGCPEASGKAAATKLVLLRSGKLHYNNGGKSHNN